jgi:hypothetical protein
MTAAVIDIERILSWLAGEPKAAARPNALALLYRPTTRIPDAEFATNLNLRKNQK